MHKPIVIAYHLIWTAYGWWLPNDPRGSMSKFIASDIIAELGELHHGRKRVQPASRQIREFYDKAAGFLKFAPLVFGPADVNAIASAFEEVIQVERYTCYACAIMPDHIHLLIRKHKHLAEEMIANFQRASHLRLKELNLIAVNHPVWGGPGWKVFLDHPADVWRTIPYIDDNPIKRRLAGQRWSFVTPYDNWPLHRGHSPNSPFARRLKGEG